MIAIAHFFRNEHCIKCDFRRLGCLLVPASETPTPQVMGFLSRSQAGGGN